MPHRASEPALQAYLNAIQKIGKGTGKRAVRYRQDAREAAAEAIAAVPCWIMPHYRVSESLPARLGCFDLVIIDEASQSDLSALPALLRGQKLLIVGDDKQVSPEGVGLEEQKIKTLMQRFLSEQVPVYRAQMSPERSIYDLAKVVFARSGVMLKEHFRCVAPIIEYSKREFYQHELRPLRLPKTSERLDPPLVDIFIEDAQRKDDVNLAEIDFIVGEVRRLSLPTRAWPAAPSAWFPCWVTSKRSRPGIDSTTNSAPSCCSAIKSRAATRALSRAGSATSCSCPWSRHPTRSVRRCPETSSRRDSTWPRLAPAIGCISYAR